MNSLWQAAIIALAIATIALAVLVLGLLRRAIDALDRVEAVLTASSSQTDHSGTLHGWQHTVGETHTLPGVPSLPVDRPHLVTFLEAGCEGCRLLAKDVTRQQRRAASSSVPLVFVLDSADGLLGQLQKKFPCVMDVDHAIADAWHVNASPVTFLVDPSGLVLAGDATNTLQQLPRPERPLRPGRRRNSQRRKSVDSRIIKRKERPCEPRTQETAHCGNDRYLARIY